MQLNELSAMGVAARRAKAEKRRAKVAQLRADGLSSAQIAAELGENPRTIYQDIAILKMERPDIKKTGTRRKRTTTDKVVKRRTTVAKLLADGRSGAQIAAELGENRRTIYLDIRIIKSEKNADADTGNPPETP